MGWREREGAVDKLINRKSEREREREIIIKVIRKVERRERGR